MSQARPRPDLLAAIVAATERRVAVARQRVSQDALERYAAHAAPRGQAFRAAVERPGRVNVIAECKRRSPSRGVLRQDYHPVEIACAYERSGAVAVSVLTEPAFFDGSLEHLAAIRNAVGIPLLRKDFVIHPYQLVEASVHGADAVLLIVAALDDRLLRELVAAARQLGLAPLVEVRDAGELDRALAAGADLIGVNNRDLRTLAVKLQASHDVARRLPSNVTAVSESGLKSASDIAELQALGYRAFLVGEWLMTEEDPGAALARLLTAAEQKAPRVVGETVVRTRPGTR
jgi:indole-3-glycerol phosphate synthase